ncbi:MAG: 2Fe-2S iron-sulfur cluster-binding protein, partial [Desulfitobacteriaceae bacterium]
MKEYRVKFIPQNKEVTVLAGTTVMQAGESVGISMEAPCGGHGTCGKCVVRCYSLNAEPTGAEKEKIKPELLAAGWRLACRTLIKQDMVVEVPDQAGGRLIKGTLAEAKIDWKTEPALIKEHLLLDKPSLIDQRADWERVQDLLSVWQTKVDLRLLQQLPGLLRQTPDLTAVTFRGEIMALEPGNTTGYAFGCAVDIGTTTVVCSLHDLLTGRQLAVASAFNPQRAYGADVLARIDFSLADTNLEKLQSLIVEQINSLIEEVSVQAGIDRDQIYVLSVVGNTTMQHLFLGLSPKHIAVPPVVGVLY